MRRNRVVVSWEMVVYKKRFVSLFVQRCWSVYSFVREWKPMSVYSWLVVSDTVHTMVMQDRLNSLETLLIEAISKNIFPY